MEQTASPFCQNHHYNGKIAVELPTTAQAHNWPVDRHSPQQTEDGKSGQISQWTGEDGRGRLWTGEDEALLDNRIFGKRAVWHQVDISEFGASLTHSLDEIVDPLLAYFSSESHRRITKMRIKEVRVSAVMRAGIEYTQVVMVVKAGNARINAHGLGQGFEEARETALRDLDSKLQAMNMPSLAESDPMLFQPNPE